jgi:hypothetical protein
MDLRGKHKVLTGSPDFLFVRLAQQPQQVLLQKNLEVAVREK